jgi:hypothetical protein
MARTLRFIAPLVLIGLASGPSAAETGGVVAADYECEGSYDSVLADGEKSAEAEIVYQFAAGGDNLARSAASFRATISSTGFAEIGSLASIMAPDGSIAAPGCMTRARVSFSQGYRAQGTFTDTVQARIDYSIDWLVSVPEEGPEEVSSFLNYEFVADDEKRLGEGAFEVTAEGVIPSGIADSPGIVITPLGRGLHSVEGGGHITITVSVPSAFPIGLELVGSASAPTTIGHPITVTNILSRGLSFQVVSLTPGVTIVADTVVPPHHDCAPSEEIAILIEGCLAAARNHGQLVSCVAQGTKGFMKDGVISGREKGEIVSCVAKLKAL